MTRKKIYSMLALLCLTVSGAWAQEETLLTTILSTGDNASFTSGSKTFNNIATVTFSGNVDNDDDYWGWYSDPERTLTVTAAGGYIITRVKFYTNSNSAFVEEAPFQAILVYDEDDNITKVNGTSIGGKGVTKIEVYGYAGTPEPAAAPALNLTSPAVGQVIGDDGKNYDYASLPGGVTAVAKICYVSGSNGLALALTDEGLMKWSTAISTCAAHTPAFTGGTWKLATQDEWNNMITAAGSYTALRDGFSGISGASNLQEGNYWSGTEYGASYALLYDFSSGSWSDDEKGTDDVRVRACLAWAQGSDPDPAYTVTLKEGTEDATSWTIAPPEATTTGVAQGTQVTASYGGVKKVKSVKAKKKAAAVAEGHALSASEVGEIVCSDGLAYAAADKDKLPQGVTAVAMVAYLGNGSDCTNGLAIQLNSSPVSKTWAEAKTYAEGLTAVPGGTWRLPSKDDWQNMFLGCAKSGDASSASNNMNPIAGFKEKITAAGVTWQSVPYWSSTDSGTDAWRVDVILFDSNALAAFYESATSTPFSVLACLAF